MVRYISKRGPGKSQVLFSKVARSRIELPSASWRIWIRQRSKL